jgi:hypothetical protein
VFTELLSGNALIKSVTICNNCVVLIFLAGMYYILSVNVVLCYISCVYEYLRFSGLCWCRTLLSYSGCVCSDCECFMLLVPHFLRKEAGVCCYLE